MKNIILFIYLLSYVFIGFSQNPKIIDTLEIHNQIKSYGIDEKNLDFKYHFFSDIIFLNDSTLLYNPNSTLHLFKIHLGDIPRVSKISKETHSGHNYNRHLFLYDDILYSYGGQGLFNSFPDLLYFDYSTKDWIIKEIKNYPFDAQKVLNSWKIGNKIIVLLSTFSEIETAKLDTKLQLSFGEINLDNFEYIQKRNFTSTTQELLFQSGLGFFRGNYIYDSDLYSLHGYYQEYGNIKYRIFDKKLASFQRTTELDKLKPVNGFSYIYIRDSTICYRDQHGKIEYLDVDLGKTLHSKDYFKLYKSKSKIISPYYIISIIIIICIVIFYFIKWKKASYLNSLTDTSKQEIFIIENKLKNLKPKIITKEQLDDLLEISHHTYETTKTKRSEIISIINKNTKIKITRVRKQNDKRFFDYKIS
ncbi:MAG: hypothetical protein EVA43_01700 [Flavobacteriales bacterium]|nr:MAG: hypothetical protein EVA43_01700 [Flavobacteriales bacterium]